LLFSPAFAKPAGHVLYVKLSERTAIKLRWIPPGHFTMGSPPDELGRSKNEDQVSVQLTRGYYLAETELTQAQWKLVILENPSAFRGDTLPVETITWADARRFCDLLNQQQRKAGILPNGYHWDLPTESQWEYACRAGTTAALHHGIDLTAVDSQCRHLGQVAWYQVNAGGHTRPVASRKANRWGLRDMHGNVWEWCRDSYTDKHPGGIDPWIRQGSDHVRRGGSAGYQARTCRAANRDGLEPSAKGNGLGLRLALVPLDYQEKR
jgi:formylglycine-generating enzyme required for sulfatase activity